ncbi:MAG TPA: hypothetical protein VF864_10410 [Gemmatimonadales bacterium]
MSSETLLALLGAALSGFAALYSVLNVQAKRTAEAELLRKLSSDTDFLSFLTHHRNLLVHAKRESLSDEELEITLRAMKRALDELQTQYRRQVAEALEQPSPRGRANYLAKLLTESAGALSAGAPAA